MPLTIASFSLGSPLTSPKLNGQFRNGMRTSTIRKWLPLFACACVIFVFTQFAFLDGRSGEQKQHVQAIQHVHNHINPPTLPYGTDFPQTRASPVKTRADFPPKIWQTWKVDPLHFEERDLNTARSWTDKNPDWRYEVLTDGNDMRYVEFHYGPEGFNRPDIVAFYRDVQAAIIKADLLRYLVMYAEGGVYADIDVEATKPMSKFIPERYDHRDINMVIGVEIDEPEWKDHPILGPKSRSFCQWTFMCKPQLPVMMRLVENIMSWLVEVARNQAVPLGDVVLDFDEVISGTGPSAFTKAIIAQMNEDRLLESSQEDGNAPAEITWDSFHDLDESKLLDRVLVLNVEAFAAGQGHSDSGTHDTRHSLVRHHYHASNWPSRHPRYKHPAYGQVEDCNWNRDCVHKWDEDVATFATLSQAEQNSLIEEKEKRIAQEAAEEEMRIKKEEEDRAREEDEQRRADEERQRLEDEARKAEEEQKARESTQVPASSGGSILYHWFGYIVFVCCIGYVVSANKCLERRQGPTLPTSTSEMLKV
ncbi:unnamed protein product [Discula destructiva]